VHIEVFGSFKEEYLILSEAHPSKHALIGLIDIAPY
jgi:hypothetical protein